MSAMGMDKKVQGKRVHFVLLDAIGSSRVSADYDEQRLDELVRAA
jgi:3-dehydroquinate synthetase